MIAMLLATPSLAGSMPDPSINAPQPMRTWTYRAVDALGQRICYEGSRNDIATGQITSSGTGAAGLQRAIDELAAASHPVRFASKTVSGREVVYVSAERGADGSWSSHQPLLDTRIDIPDGTRTINDALAVWAAALQERSGQPIVDVRWLAGEAVTSAAGTDVVARDLLVRILDDAGGGFFGPNLVWSLVWVERYPGWALGFQRVWSLEKLDQGSRAADAAPRDQ